MIRISQRGRQHNIKERTTQHTQKTEKTQKLEKTQKNKKVKKNSIIMSRRQHMTKKTQNNTKYKYADRAAGTDKKHKDET